MDHHELKEAKMDEEFERCLKEIEPYLSGDNREIVTLWVQRLSQHVSDVGARWNQNGNMKLLLQMLKKNVSGEPGTGSPEDDGKIPPVSAASQYAKLDMKTVNPSPKDFAWVQDKKPEWLKDELLHSSESFSSMMGFGQNRTTTTTTNTNTSSNSNAQYPFPAEFDFGDRQQQQQQPWSPGVRQQQQQPWSPGVRQQQQQQPWSPGVRQQQQQQQMMYQDSCHFDRNRSSLKPVISSSTESMSVGSSQQSSVIDRPHAPPATLSGKPLGSRIDIQGGANVHWRHPTESRSPLPAGPNMGLIEENKRLSRSNTHCNCEQKLKLMEAKFLEEKLQAQVKHRDEVTAILDRKNDETEAMKADFNEKRKELETDMFQLEAEVNSMKLELEKTKEMKEKQMEEFKSEVTNRYRLKEAECDHKVESAVKEMKEEKENLQRQHSKNIKSMLEEANTRLETVEAAYKKQNEEDANTIKELHSKVEQLVLEAGSISSRRNILASKNEELQETIASQKEECESLKQSESNLKERLAELQQKHTETVANMKEHFNKTCSTMKSKQEQLQDKLLESSIEHEACIQQLKEKLQDAESLYHTLRQELDTAFHDREQLKKFHDEQMDALKRERCQAELTHTNTVQDLKATLGKKEKKIEADKNKIKEKDSEIEHWRQMVDAKKEECNRILEDMGLNCSYTISDLKRKFDEETSKRLEEQKMEKDNMLRDFSQQKESLRLFYNNEAEKSEKHFVEERNMFTKRCCDLEEEVKRCQEKWHHSEKQYKMQLSEGQLIHKEQMRKLQSQVEQQRNNIQKSHTDEINKIIEKKNSDLKRLEEELCARIQITNNTISELQNTICKLNKDIGRQKEESEIRIGCLQTKHKEEITKIRRQNTVLLEGLQQKYDEEYSNSRNHARQLEQQISCYEEQLAEIKIHYENKIKDLMPSSVRHELEDTIHSLRQQVASLRKTVSLLQNDQIQHHKSLQDCYSPGYTYTSTTTATAAATAAAATAATLASP